MDEEVKTDGASCSGAQEAPQEGAACKGEGEACKGEQEATETPEAPAA